MSAYVNPANAVTAARYLTLPLFWYWLDRGAYQLAALTVIGCAVLDKLDGAVAKVFDCQSSFGELFDAVTDALCYGFFLVVLAGAGRLPWLPVAGILLLGAANSAFRLVYARRLGRAANFHSYAMVKTVTLVVFLAGFGTLGIEPAYYTWSLLVIVGVVVAYDAKRMLVDPT